MADIKFNGFVEDVIRNQSGEAFALKTTEPHRRKNDQGGWETTARTYRDVKVSRDSGITLEQFTKGDRVEIVGNEKTERIRSQAGKDIYPLVVWASSITRAGNDRHTATEQPQGAYADSFDAQFGSETPF